MKNYRGFTLIELMVVLAVLAIIMSIALPAYNEQSAKARRSEAQATLGDMAMRQNRFRADNPTYATTLVQLGFAAGFTSTHYSYSIPAATATSFSLQGTPRGSHASDRCANLTYQWNATTGVTTKGTSAVGETRCW